MFPLNDLSLKTQSVQLNKVTSNTDVYDKTTRASI